MELIVIVSIVLIAFVVIGTLIYNSLEISDLSYRNREDLLTKTEAEFFSQLIQNLPEKYYALAKVNLSDVIEPKTSGKNYMNLRNKIRSKHLDFVITEKDNSKIVMVIELDDKSHLSVSAKERDRIKNLALESARIPLIRIKPAVSYDFSFLTEF